MLRYVALAWNPADQQAAPQGLRATQTVLLSRRHRPWGINMSAPGIAILTQTPQDTSLRIYPIADGLGLVLGRLFGSRPTTRCMSGPELPSNRILATEGRSLFEDYWGQYIAIFRSRLTGECHVIRDPSGALPCFYVRIGSVFAFFADIRDISCLNPRVTVNEHYLASFIGRQPLHVRDTGLNEVTELLAGDSVKATGDRTTQRSLWNPRAFVSQIQGRKYAEYRDILLATTESVITARARLHRRILLSLSGGLDSAIVLGCLARAGLSGQVSCVTHYIPGTATDERSYARAAAEMARVGLTELPLESDGIAFLNGLALVPADPRPDISKANRVLTVRKLNELATDLGCDTLWTGQGGDQMFLQRTHAYGVADYCLQDLQLRKLPILVYETALLSKKSVWSIAGETLVYTIRRNKFPAEVLGGRGRRFLLPIGAGSGQDNPAATPWLVPQTRMPPGKVDQINVLFDLLNRHKPLTGLEMPYEQHPLISQPLLELSLRIPTYHLLQGGRQRAMARDAFRDRVPPSIIKREDKGSTADQLRSLLRQSIPLVRERLLDGALASLGILNRKELESILAGDATFAKDELFPLFACVVAETWLGHWKPPFSNPGRTATDPPFAVRSEPT